MADRSDGHLSLRLRSICSLRIFSLLATLLLLILSACSRSDPGPLAGAWRLGGAIPLTVHFRSGETETMGLIEKVSYEVTGNQIIVRYESGPIQGTAIRYTVTGRDSLRSEFGVLQRLN